MSEQTHAFMNDLLRRGRGVAANTPRAHVNRLRREAEEAEASTQVETAAPEGDAPETTTDMNELIRKAVGR